MTMADARPDYSKIRLRASKAIRAKCLDCVCWQPSEVRECTTVTCPLWRWRMGKEQVDELYYLARGSGSIDSLENDSDVE
jgi:hypothetical protein